MKNDIETQDSDLETRIYEVGYLIVPSVAQEKLSDKVSSLRSMIETVGGKIVEEGDPKYQDLAYDMATTVENKRIIHKTGYFGWIKFEADPSMTSDITKKLEKDIDLIRFLMIKTIRENTLAPIEAVFASEAEEKSKKERAVVTKTREIREEKKGTPASKEEIDESIEKLIVE